MIAICVMELGLVIIAMVGVKYAKCLSVLSIE